MGTVFVCPDFVMRTFRRVIDHESEDLIDFVLITEMGFFVLLLRLGLPS